MMIDEYLLKLYPLEKTLFKYHIDKWPIYPSVRRAILVKYFKANNVDIMHINDKIDYIASLRNGIVSAWHLLLLYMGSRRAETVFVPFMRVDKVGAFYMDKFTDPFIEFCFKGREDYIIIDQGRAGKHLKPRMHKGKCLQTDIFVIIERLYGRIHCKEFYKKNKEVIDAFEKDIRVIYGSNVEVSPQFIALSVCQHLMYMRLYKWLFTKLNAKRVIFPTRRIFEIFVAKELGIKTFECQHGITYGETIVYGGYIPEVLKPDFFLAFGQNDPIDVYGIEPERIVNVGWAFGDFLSQSKSYVQYGEKDVLVISDPGITDRIINITILLATANPNSHFYVRPHPQEEICEMQKKQLESLANCSWQDCNINIAMVLQGFTHVVGESSTVLYEALSVGKKVGKLFFNGLSPRYLKDEDRDYFWEIRDQDSFNHFLNDGRNARKSKCIYSAFDKELFLKILEIK